METENWHDVVALINYSPFTTLTATGIAPVLHRISLLMLTLIVSNQIDANVWREVFPARRVFNKEQDLKLTKKIIPV